MSVSVASVLKKVTTILNDLEFDRWSDSELIGWLNDGQRAVAIQRPDAKMVSRSQQLVSGAKQTVADDVIAVIDVAYNTNGNAVTPCDKKSLDAFYPGWTQKLTGASVTHWMPTEDPNVFYVYPAQGSAPASVEIVAGAYPAQVSAGNNIDIREIYTDKLINYILYRAFSKDAEIAASAERAVAYYNAFKE